MSKWDYPIKPGNARAKTEQLFSEATGQGPWGYAPEYVLSTVLIYQLHKHGLLEDDE